MSDERIRLAESFLQEAVYQSRARQAAGVGLAGGRPEGPQGSMGCGLGPIAPDLELTERGEELFQELWPRQLAPTEVARIQQVMRDWVERQDALDRKRNHFLRDFRQTNGFDRRAYTRRQASEFEAGLAAINAEADTRLRETAETLLGEV